jgi:hypothetical protein
MKAQCSYGPFPSTKPLVFSSALIANIVLSTLWLLNDLRLGRKGPNVIIIGVDYHPSFQTIAFFVEETGEYAEQELNHSDGQAEKFYRELKQRRIRVRVGMEATGYSRWFERLLAELGFEVWMGDPARRVSLEEKTIQRTGASAVRKAGVSSLGQSTSAEVVGVAGPHKSDDRGVNRSCRAGSQETTRGSASDDASWRWSAYGTGLCVDHRNSDSVSSWQADRHLGGHDSQ